MNGADGPASSAEPATQARVVTDLRDDSRIRVLTLSDPAKLNAIGDELRNGLAEHLAAATADARCRVIIITGANEAFSAGGELGGMPTEPDAIRRRIGTLHEIVRMFVQCPQVVIAAVDGVAFGSGMSLAAAADVVIASERSRFGCTFGRVGLIPDVGFMWSVPRRIGARRARLMVLENAIIEADQGLDWGLVDVLCPAGDALDQALAKAAQITRTPAATVANAKRMLAANFADLDAVLEDELNRQIELLASEEFAAARDKFLSRADAGSCTDAEPR
jgi:2-(1,2-epoxy-1,2-dihydrophenyl)acetyl-CoA isomerase